MNETGYRGNIFIKIVTQARKMQENAVFLPGSILEKTSLMA